VAGIGGEELEALAREYARSRDPSLRDRVIEAGAGLVQYVARSFASDREPLEDLLQEGYIGLIKAVDLYDPGYEVKFATYANHLISGEIRHYLRDRCALIKEPAWLYELNQRINRVISELSQSLGRLPTVPEISAKANLREESVLEVLKTRNLFRVESTEQFAADQQRSDPVRVERHKIRSLRLEDFRLPIEDKIRIYDAIAKLKPLQRAVLHFHFFAGLSQTETARKMGVSDNYVSHLLRTALRRLREIIVSEDAAGKRVRVRRAVKVRPVAPPAPSGIDLATGLFTQGGFMRRLEEELARAARYLQPLAYAVIDIDGLAEFNRKYGASAGEEAIIQVAQVIRHNVRKVDIGGKDEGGSYSLLLPHTGRSAMTVLERIREQTAALEFSTEDNGTTVPAGSLRVSIGFAYREPHQEEGPPLPWQAHKALLVAKAQGGNQVVCYADVAEAVEQKA